MTKLGKTLMALSTATSLGVVATALVNTAHADVFYQYYNTDVQVNGITVSSPGHISANDPFGGPNGAVTSFLPIWYIDQALGKFGATVQWGGSNGILNITTPSGMTVNYPTAPKTMTINSGNMVIQINGKPVAYAPRISTYDSGTVITTTFVPVYYLEKSIEHMGITTGWDGTNWTMQYGSAPTPTPTPTPTGSTPKLDAAVAFAKAIGLQPVNSGSGQYTDVPSADAGYVNALTKVYKENNYSSNPLFTPDSSSTFGSADQISVETLATAFAAYSGIANASQYSTYLPGGSVVGLSSVTGLLDGVPTSGNLSSSQVSTLMNNLATIVKGYVALGNNTYRLVYHPNYFGIGFHTSLPASVWSSDWANAIKVTDATTIQYTGGEYITTTTDPSDAGWATTSGNFLEIQGGIPGQSYSLDGGTTWHVANGSYGFDSLDSSNGGVSNPPSQVKLMSSQGGGLLVRYDYNGVDQSFTNAGLEFQNGQPVAGFQ